MNAAHCVVKNKTVVLQWDELVMMTHMPATIKSLQKVTGFTINRVNYAIKKLNRERIIFRRGVVANEGARNSYMFDVSPEYRYLLDKAANKVVIEEKEQPDESPVQKTITQKAWTKLGDAKRCPMTQSFFGGAL